jgi:hypothetical protein
LENRYGDGNPSDAQQQQAEATSYHYDIIATMVGKLLLHFTLCLCSATALLHTCTSFRRSTPSFVLHLSDWSDFSALDDEEAAAIIDRTDYAREEDSQEYKAQVGATLEPPTIERDAEPILVPQGKTGGCHLC